MDNPEQTPSTEKPVIDRRSDWRRAHWGLYVLPGMSLLNAFFVVLAVPSLYPVAGAVFGGAGAASHYYAGRTSKVRDVLIFEAIMIAFAAAGFWITSLS